ncbi:hypothetical protein F4777DRAFT_106596 [Nemania sp. FL0916]|nr:hypothetical protein F4777DRAFT_106596 [Nemania sp. FL0916]
MDTSRRRAGLIHKFIQINTEFPPLLRPSSRRALTSKGIVLLLLCSRVLLVHVENVIPRILWRAAARSICLASRSSLSLYSSSRSLSMNGLSLPPRVELVSPCEVCRRPRSDVPRVEELRVILLLAVALLVVGSRWVVLLRGSLDSLPWGPVGTRGEGLPPSISGVRSVYPTLLLRASRARCRVACSILRARYAVSSFAPTSSSARPNYSLGLGTLSRGHVQRTQFEIGSCPRVTRSS